MLNNYERFVIKFLALFYVIFFKYFIKLRNLNCSDKQLRENNRIGFLSFATRESRSCNVTISEYGFNIWRSVLNSVEIYSRHQALQLFPRPIPGIRPVTGNRVIIYIAGNYRFVVECLKFTNGSDKKNGVWIHYWVAKTIFR